MTLLLWARLALLAALAAVVGGYVWAGMTTHEQ
jgi:hypothetical protein